MLDCCQTAPRDLAAPLLGSATSVMHAGGRGGMPAAPAVAAAAAAEAAEQQCRERVREGALRFWQQAMAVRQRANREAGVRLRQLDAEARQRARGAAQVGRRGLGGWQAAPPCSARWLCVGCATAVLCTLRVHGKLTHCLS